MSFSVWFAINLGLLLMRMFVFLLWYVLPVACITNKMGTLIFPMRLLNDFSSRSCTSIYLGLFTWDCFLHDSLFSSRLMYYQFKKNCIILWSCVISCWDNLWCLNLLSIFLGNILDLWDAIVSFVLPKYQLHSGMSWVSA